MTVEKNIFLEIEYLGTNYFGFQVQAKGRGQVTVQEVLEKALFRLFKKKIRVIASGRTDKGVHARAQVVNFKSDTGISLPSIKTALNIFLPQDIRIRKIKLVPAGFHARFSAKSKVYRYIIFKGEEDLVFWRNFAWCFSAAFDLEKMKKASGKLRGKKDFSLFAKGAKNYKNCKRRVKDISIKKRANLIYIDIEAEGFLRFMVRNMIFFLVRTAMGKIFLKDIPDILKGKIPYANKPAPAGGLYLYRVIY